MEPSNEQIKKIWEDVCASPIGKTGPFEAGDETVRLIQLEYSISYTLATMYFYRTLIYINPFYLFM